MISPVMAQHIELWPVERLAPNVRNARTHSDAQIAQIAASIAEFGFNTAILVDSADGIVAGHGRLLAARKLGLAEVPVVVLDHLSQAQRRAYAIADNRLQDLSGWDETLLAEELEALRDQGVDLDLVGFSDADLQALIVEGETTAEPAQAGVIPEPPTVAITRPGDLWLIGAHRLVCGDCRDPQVIVRLFEGAKANVVVTSPPYATQREYDPSSGFQPVAPDEYVAWYRDVANSIRQVLADDGSYVLNIKEHAEDGQRSLYVKDLVVAHVRQWGWRFVDEFCWRKTDNGVPGGWNNRFKNAWEPVFHFTGSGPAIKFRPQAVSHVSEDCFEYSPDNPKSTSGSGLLGTGPRGSAAGRLGAGDEEGRHRGLARPSNVIEAKSESTQGAHSAPFPRALAEFFIKAFSDPGDVIFDPFQGSGTTLVAAGVLDRAGYGCEISPGYCDVILQRATEAFGIAPKLAGTGETFAEVAHARNVLF